jgi:predicted component of type VI protein secretion system
LPEGEDARRLRRVVRLYAPDHLAYDVELNVVAEELPPTSLGEGEAQLGYTTRLGGADDPVRSRIVEYE